MSTLQFKHLAIIPARSGSQGLPKKNIKSLRGKPMMAYSIEAAKHSGCFDKMIVSTDATEIAEIAEQYGADVPFLRPKELSTSTATSLSVIVHALDFFKDQQTFFDVVTLLQPTSPLRDAKDILQAMQLFKEKNAESVVSVNETESPMLVNTLPEDKNLKNFLAKNVLHKSRQELPIHYKINGAIYMVKTELIERQTFYGDRSYAYVMPRERSIDVDDIVDFYCCEALLNGCE